MCVCEYTHTLYVPSIQLNNVNIVTFQIYDVPLLEIISSSLVQCLCL